MSASLTAAALPDVSRTRCKLRYPIVDNDIFFIYASSEIVRSGMANARAKGRKIGRPQVTADDIPASFLRHYPSYKAGKMNLSDMIKCPRREQQLVVRPRPTFSPTVHYNPFFGHNFRPHPFIIFSEKGTRSRFFPKNSKNPLKPRFQGIMELMTASSQTLLG